MFQTGVKPLTKNQRERGELDVKEKDISTVGQTCSSAKTVVNGGRGTLEEKKVVLERLKKRATSNAD